MQEGNATPNPNYNVHALSIPGATFFHIWKALPLIPMLVRNDTRPWRRASICCVFLFGKSCQALWRVALGITGIPRHRMGQIWLKKHLTAIGLLNLWRNVEAKLPCFDERMTAVGLRIAKVVDKKRIKFASPLSWKSSEKVFRWIWMKNERVLAIGARILQK